MSCRYCGGDNCGSSAGGQDMCALIDALESARTKRIDPKFCKGCAGALSRLMAERDELRTTLSKTAADALAIDGELQACMAERDALKAALDLCVKVISATEWNYHNAAENTTCEWCADATGPDGQRLFSRWSDQKEHAPDCFRQRVLKEAAKALGASKSEVSK